MTGGLSARRHVLALIGILLAAWAAAAQRAEPPPYERPDPLGLVTDEQLAEALAPLAPPEGKERADFLAEARALARDMETKWDEYGPAEAARIRLGTRLLALRMSLLWRERRDLGGVVELVDTRLDTADRSIAALSVLTGAAELCRRHGREWKAIELLARAGALAETRLKALGTEAERRAAVDAARAEWDAASDSHAALIAYWNARGRHRLRRELGARIGPMAHQISGLAGSLEWKHSQRPARQPPEREEGPASGADTTAP